jgi:hypothetical protein
VSTLVIKSSSFPSTNLICSRNLSVAAQVHVVLLNLIGQDEILKNTRCKFRPVLSDSAEDGGYFVTPKSITQTTTQDP